MSGTRAASGFGWTLAAFEPQTRVGEVAFGEHRLPFDASAAADEDLRVGDEVFVRLQPGAGASHVVRVWPCLARLRTRPDLPDAPPLPEAVAEVAAMALARAPAPTTFYPFDRGGGRIALVTADTDPNEYGIAGVDLAVRGAIVCDRARPITRQVPFEAAEIRLALAGERALIHAESPLARAQVVVALIERRAEFSPEQAAEVWLVACEGVRWDPGPPCARAETAMRALVAIAPFGTNLSAVVRDDDALVAVLPDRRERFFALADPSEAATFVPWCEVLTALLRMDPCA